MELMLVEWQQEDFGLAAITLLILHSILGRPHREVSPAFRHRDRTATIKRGFVFPALAKRE
jgi:hypothetical protein